MTAPAPDTIEREREKRRKLSRPVEAHVYMAAEDRAGLEDWAKDECRSVNGQILHIIREALASRRQSIVTLSPASTTDRVRDATRRAVAETRK
jgi:hypothetical protein